MKALLPLAMIFAISAGWAADVVPLADDPTRPPEGMVAADGSMASANSVGLTSVMLPKKGGRASAIIDGQLVVVGGTVRDSTLVKVSESSVVLEGASGREVLYLTPDVEKTARMTKTAPRR